MSQKNLLTTQQKDKKRLYDIGYRKRNKERIKRNQQEYNRSPAGRAMQKRNREKFKKSHLEYCRTEEYRKWKRNYDQEYRYEKIYGEFWECMMIARDIFNEVRKQVPDKYERCIMRGQIDRMMLKQKLRRQLKIKAD